MPLSSQSLFSNERKLSRLSTLSQDGAQIRLSKSASDQVRLGKFAPEVRLKAKSGAISRGVYRSKSMSKANEMKKRAMAVASAVEAAKACLSDLDAPREDNHLDEALQVKSESDLPNVRDVSDLPTKIISPSAPNTHWGINTESNQGSATNNYSDSNLANTEVNSNVNSEEVISVTNYDDET